MKQEYRTLRPSLIGIVTSAALLLSATPCMAAAVTAALPWDYAFLALQDMLISYIAPAAIGLAFSGSIVLYALGGRDEQAGRLFGSALGGCIALAHRQVTELRPALIRSHSN